MKSVTHFLSRLWPCLLGLFIIQSYLISHLLIQCGYISSDLIDSDVSNDMNHVSSLYKPTQTVSKQISDYWWHKSVKEQIYHQTQRELELSLPPLNTKNKQVKAALVLLIRNTAIFASLKRLQKMTLKTCKFLLKYPVYILTNHLEELNSTQMDEINTFRANADHKNIEIINIDKYWHISHHYSISSDFMPDAESYEMYHGINYRIMCYFHTSVIFDIPQIAQLDYYMRLDDDSELICSNGNVLFNRRYTMQMNNDNIDQNVNNLNDNQLLYNMDKMDKKDFKEIDVFEYMYHHRYIYSYWKTEVDPHDWTRNFIPFILSYKKRNNLKFNMEIPSYMKEWDINGTLPSSLNKQHAPMFFNNWEINYVPYFRSKSVREFNNAVILSNGHFLYRWGDAPIRYFQIALFLNESNLFCAQDAMWRKYFSYYHKKDFHHRAHCDINFDHYVDLRGDEKIVKLDKSSKKMLINRKPP